MKLFLKSLIRMLWIVLVILLVGVTLLYFLQDRLVFFPRPYGVEHEPVAKRYRAIEFEVSGAGKQFAYYLGPPVGLPQKLWILTGGNGSLALGWDFVTGEAFRKNPAYGYLLVEYPGYGSNPGKATRQNIHEGVEGAVESLARTLGTAPETLRSRSSFMGHSLGAAVALEMAADWKRGEVILIAPFTSMRDIAGKMVGGWLARLARHRWDNRTALRTIAGLEGARIYIVHGTADEVIPVAMGRELAAIAPDATTWHEREGSRHNEIVWEIRDELIKRLAR